MTHRTSWPRGGSRQVIGWLILSLISAITAMIFVVSRETDGVRGAGDVALVPVAHVTAGAQARPVYRHSVIPGGVYSQAELMSAADRDPVVRDLYGSVVRTVVQVRSVNTPRRAYMSYRIGDQIYWTKRKLLLAAGEMILTNGEIEIRARCGNEISDRPMTPTSSAEPEEIEFDRLLDDDPVLSLSRAELLTVGPAPEGLWSAAPPAAPGMEHPFAVDNSGRPGDGGMLGSGGLAGSAALAGSGQPETRAQTPPGASAASPPASTAATERPPPVVDVPPSTLPERPVPTTGASPQPPGDIAHDTVPPYWVPSYESDVPPVPVIPEPATFLLLGTGVAGLAAVLFRRARAKKRHNVPTDPE